MGASEGTGCTSEQRQGWMGNHKTINLGDGGECNKINHENSKEHKRKIKPPPSTLGPMAAFLARNTASSSASHLSAPRKVSNTALMRTVSQRDASPSHLHAETSSRTSRPHDLYATQLLERLKAAVRMLPPQTPLGRLDEPLGAFSTQPVLPPGEDAWETIDPILNKLVGFGKPVEEIAALIRHGPYGMDGFCAWLTECLTWEGISASLVEGKVMRLLDVLVKWCVFSNRE